jgi:hypothetical protein
MTTVRFVVETTFDLEDEGTILAPGQLLTGQIRPGMTLRTLTTGRPMTVRAVEFRCSAAPVDRTNGVTLVIDRADATALETGTILVSPR